MKKWYIYRVSDDKQTVTLQSKEGFRDKPAAKIAINRLPADVKEHCIPLSFSYPKESYPWGVEE
jgi:hypothetical protein